MGFKNCRPAVIVVCRYFQIPDFSITAIAACQLGLLAPMLGVGVAVFHDMKLPLDGNARWARATSGSSFAGKKDVRTYEWQS
jgi:hypothetical protein